MPILLIFLVAAACLPVEWPAPPFGLGPAASASLTGLLVAACLAAAFAVRTWVIRSLRRDPLGRIEVGIGYSRLRRLLFFVNVGAVAVAILGLGWGWTTQETLVIDRDGTALLAPFAELAVPLPYFLIVFGCWLIYFDAERALHRAGGFANREFWSRTGYFVHHLRQLALLIGLPIGLFVTQQSLARFAPETARTDWYRVLSVATVPVLILFLPLLIKPLLGLRSLPPGPERDRFEALARRLRFRYTDLLLWPTHGAIANAMIVGLVPRVRYVIFTDRLLEEMPPDEADAVFGHEVGHAKHGHIWYYAAFLALSMAVLAALFLLLGQTLDRAGVTIPDGYVGWLSLPPVAVTAAYIFLAFGFLSRRCERQADVYGCRAVSCADPNCMGHTPLTVYPAGGTGLCRTGILTFTRALERVGLVNGFTGPAAGERRTVGGVVRAVFGWLRAWQHATLPRRVAFLLDLIEHPERERRFQWRVWLLRWALIIGLVAALVGLGQVVGWRAMLQAV